MLSILLSMGEDMLSLQDKQESFRSISRKLKTVIPFNDLVICLTNTDKATHTPFVLDMESVRNDHPAYGQVSQAIIPVEDGIFNKAIKLKEPISFDMDELMKRDNNGAHIEWLYATGIREMLCVSLHNKENVIGVLFFFMEEKHRIATVLYPLIQSVAYQLSLAVINLQANERIRQQLTEIDNYRQQLEMENSYLQEEIKARQQRPGPTGAGAAMARVQNMIRQVAPSDSTILLTGETGTGKEITAHAIHDQSLRSEKLLVKINCAALPASLIESELFGHERGSFTGAFEQRIGKFELANGGTLFLDEIGEMPLELQAKLLRALQEKEIERVGGSKVIKTDVRIIAATNRNLLQEVEAGRFRQDLYFRLNVFPIHLPPLRERREEIPALAQYFLQRYAAKNGKQLKQIPEKVIQELMGYDWPGNIRELEHVMERSVILATGTVLKQVYLTDKINRPHGNATSQGIKTIDENERDHILFVLRKTRGKIAGGNGAAALLGVPPTTLHSKLKKLGIEKSHQ